MTAPTHVAFAEFVYLLLLTSAGIPLNFLNALIIAFAAILADIDTVPSTIGSILKPVSSRIERSVGHRTLTHSVLGIASLGIISLPLFLVQREIYVCLIAGYATHPFLDTMTVSGVRLFYPFSGAKCVFPLEVNNPHSYRVRTGGRADTILGVLFFLACIPIFFIARGGYE